MLQRVRVILLPLFGVVLAVAPAAAQTTDAERVVLAGDDAAGPAVLLDGREITQAELTSLDAGRIGSIEILKGPEAAARFDGKYAEHGVILVATGDPTAPLVEEGAGGAPSEAAGGQPGLDVDPEAHILIDGEVADMAALRALKPEQIEAVQVHKADRAVQLFGEVARRGAVVVVTKG